MTDTPRVWVGCLACYNEGRLNGQWSDAMDALDITIETLHNGPTDHEDLWVFDHEYLPINGEYSAAEAADWGQVMESCQDTTNLPIEVLIGIIQELSWTSPQEVDYCHLKDTYCGSFQDFSDFAQQLAEDTMEIPDHLHAYFGWQQYERDIQGDYYEIRHNGESYIFSA